MTYVILPAFKNAHLYVKRHEILKLNSQKMLGELSELQIETLLKQQVIGRIACQADGVPYIVPINYFYNGTHIFCHSAIGKKIAIMRKNPKVCFLVDDIKSVFSWQSVIVLGKFEELTDMEEKERAMQGLIHRIMPFADNPKDHPSHGIAEKEDDIATRVELVIFRIVPISKTGRFEK
jgi:nitroimidazol reductase NimA-like FMN-containing flavoprotein (pyridoxamine 5'-phosphate oxidase superfamily)